MRRFNALHLGLAVVGMVGLGLFILACTGWSGWSPDSSQVVFGYYDSNSSKYLIGIYDVKSGHARALNLQELKSNGEKWLSAQWKKDGTGLWVFKGEDEKKFLVMDVNATTGEVIERFEIPVADTDTIPIGNAVEWNGNLFVNVRPLTRIDLINKKVVQQSYDDDEGPVVFGWGEGIAYLALESEHHPEFGYLDPQTFAKNPLFEFDEQDPRFRGAEDIHPLIGTDSEGSRIAATTMRMNKEDIVICNAAGVQKVVSPQLSYSEFHLGAPVWSADGKHIYVTGMAPQKDNWSMVFLADVDAESGRAKTTPIATVKTEGDDFYKSFYLLTHAELSPDGKTIAISTAGLEKDRVKEKDRALYLIDVTDGGKRVTKVQPPKTKATN